MVVFEKILGGGVKAKQGGGGNSFLLDVNITQNNAKVKTPKEDPQFARETKNILVSPSRTMDGPKPPPTKMPPYDLLLLNQRLCFDGLNLWFGVFPDILAFPCG